MTTHIRQAFREQAVACRNLGSPFTAALCDSLADNLQADQGAVAAHVLNWQGDPRSGADSVPLRLCGALHALVLTDADPELSAAYAQRHLPAQQLVSTLQEHSAHVLDWLTLPPQTNEVARSAPLIASARFLSGLAPHTLHLRELGASAGLNLNFDKYHLGDATQGVVLRPDWQGNMPQGDFTIASRRGVDLNPLDPECDGLRLMAYCWADQDQRLARLKAALELATDNPPTVDRGDAGAWLAGQLSNPAQGTTLVFHTVAAQYFPPATQAACSDALTNAGRNATADAPLAHLQMEADGGDGAALTLTLWDGQRRDWSLGRADFHGRWVRWKPTLLWQETRGLSPSRPETKGADMEPSVNVLGTKLLPCSTDPVTGFYRNGCCDTGPEDQGSHTVCVILTDEFLAMSRYLGNDLTTPRPEYGFAGLKAGDRWCLCASRFLQAAQEFAAPVVVMECTHKRALEVVPFELLQNHSRND